MSPNDLGSTLAYQAFLEDVGLRLQFTVRSLSTNQAATAQNRPFQQFHPDKLLFSKNLQMFYSLAPPPSRTRVLQD